MAAFDYDDVDTAMDEMYRLRPAKAQFTRFADTTRWIRQGDDIPFYGNRWHYKAFLTPLTGMTSVAWSTAAASGTEFPAATSFTYQDLSYDYADMAIFQISLEINELAILRSQQGNPKHAVFDLAQKFFMEAEANAALKANTAVNISSDNSMGTVAAIYSSLGAAYTTAGTAFFQITDAPIGRFVKGMVLKVGDSETATINDVIAGDDGPWDGADDTRIADIGPGIVVTASTGDFDGVTAGATGTGDALRITGDATSGALNGLPAWFDQTVNTLNDGDGSAINRDALGNAWTVPEIITIAASGSEVVLDLDDHLGQASKIMAQIAGSRERRRQDAEKEIVWKNGLVAIGTPALIDEAAREAKDTMRFTSAAPGGEAAAKKALWGDVGFEGTVWHSPTLGPVALQSDAMASRYKLRLCNPDSWFFLSLGGKSGFKRGIQWQKTAGSRFTRKVGTNGLHTFDIVASAWMACLLGNDQPKSNVEITGVKSSL